MQEVNPSINVLAWLIGILASRAIPEVKALAAREGFSPANCQAKQSP